MQSPTQKMVSLGPKRGAFNLTLLKFTELQTRALKPVTSLDVFESFNSTDFHDQGLYSTEIFGDVGDRKRDRTFSYIDIKTTIMHPLIYKTVQRLKSFYIDIIEGRAYAKWDPTTKGFLKSNEAEGDTGYSFFMQHWKEIEFQKSTSLVRNQRVELIDKYRETGIYDKIVVLPAGLRDVEIGENGRPREDEINPIYRKLLSISNTVTAGKFANEPVYNKARVSLQANFNLLYEAIERLVQGKNGFVEDKWMSRRIINGTRNVVTAQDPSVDDLDNPDAPDSNSTVIGLWQLTKGALPTTIAKLRSHILEDVFGTVEGGARLIDPVTLKSESVHVDSSVYDRWMTTEGLERIVSLQRSVDIRDMPVKIEDRYLALVYRPKNQMVFKILYDIDELPSELSRDDVHPITYMELIYLCNYRGWNDLAVANTRYPVTNEGSTMPSIVYVATTVVSDKRVELNDNWRVPDNPDEHTALVYPNYTSRSFIDASKVSPFKLVAAGGDYDGDTFSNNILFTKEAIEEIRRYLETREAHVNPGGGLRGSTHIDTTEYVMYNLTGDPDDE